MFMIEKSQILVGMKHLTGSRQDQAKTHILFKVSSRPIILEADT